MRHACERLRREPIWLCGGSIDFLAVDPCEPAPTSRSTASVCKLPLHYKTDGNSQHSLLMLVS